MKVAIAPPQYKSQVYHKDGNTKDIINTILNVVKNYNIASETAQFSKGFKATLKDIERLYWFVKDNIEYTEDPQGFQWIRTPARTWNDRNAGLDCKSFTVFLVSVFQNLGLPYMIRFASYSPNKVPTHVYPLVKIGGRWVIMDAVYDGFNIEKNYTFKKDFNMSEIAVLSGVNRQKIGMVLYRGEQTTFDDTTQMLINEMKAVTDNIPDSILTVDGGDITQMTGGEFSRWLAAKSYSATPSVSSAIKQNLIYNDTPKEVVNFLNAAASNNEMAFVVPFDIEALNAQTAQIGSIFTKVGDWFKAQWAKLMNFIMKDGLKKSAEFFMYIYSSPITEKIRAKRDKQLKTLAWMAKAGGQNIDQYTATIRAHIMQKNGGKTPEQLLMSGTKRGIGAISAIIAALPVVIDIIKKLAALFKKNDPPVVTAEDGSDPAEYASEWEKANAESDTTQPPAIPTPTGQTAPQDKDGKTRKPLPPVNTNPMPERTTGGGSSTSDGSGMYLALAALAAFVILK